MELSKEQLQDVRVAVTYYRNRHVSANNPRYQEYEDILDVLSHANQQYNGGTD